MSATVYWQEWNGTVGAENNTSKQGGVIKFKSADDPVNDDNDKLIVPGGGVYRSFEKYVQAYLENLDGSTQLSNLEAFVTDASPNDGTAIYAKAAAAYDMPKAGGYDVSGAMDGPKASLFSYTADAPLSLGAGPFAVTGSIGDYLVLQMEVMPSAEVTGAPSYSLVIRYDEEE